MKHVRKCSDVIKKPDLNDICLNGVKCLLKQIVPMRSGNINLIKNTDCTCSHLKFKYQCTKMYCTSDKYSCDHFKMNIPKLQKKIKSCNNSRSLVKSVLSIF